MPTLGVTCAFTLGFAHYPWRDRNDESRRPPRAVDPVRSLPLEGSQPPPGPGGRRCQPTQVRSLPLEGSQLLSFSSDTPQGGGRVRSLPLEGSQHERGGRVRDGEAFAHYPWRDRNTPASPPRNQHRSVRSLPLEGSQPQTPTPVQWATVFAHYPWRDRNLTICCSCWRSLSSSLITPGGIATRDLTGVLGEPPRSLITPGGIATRALARAWRRLRPPGSLITPGGIATGFADPALLVGHWFAHYPWRDRNSGITGSRR